MKKLLKLVLGAGALVLLSANLAFAATEASQTVTAEAQGQHSISLTSTDPVGSSTLHRGDSAVSIGTNTLNISTDFADKVTVSVAAGTDVSGIQVDVVAANCADTCTGSTKTVSGLTGGAKAAQDLVTGADGSGATLTTTSAITYKATVSNSATLSSQASYPVTFTITGS